MGGFSASSFAVAAFSVSAFWFNPAVQPLPEAVSGGGVGTWHYPTQRFVAPATHFERVVIPVAEHNTEDEEEIVMAILMRIAHMEYCE